MPYTKGFIGTYRKIYEDAADETTADGAEIWYHRSQNMVNVYMKGPKGAKFVRENNPDEVFVWAIFHPLKVTAGSETQDVPAGSVVIVPPGDSTIELAENGHVWIGFTALAEDLLDRCPNKEEFEPPLDNIAPIEPWPEPVGGYKLRVYDLNASTGDNDFVFVTSCYRHRTGMCNLPWPVPVVPRDPKTMTPHTHEDFEQSSLLFAGKQVHHMRRMWSHDLSEWIPDEHMELGSPSIAISKPPDIHTTQFVETEGLVGLIDFFSPPRWDFSNVEGMVKNHEDYPMPTEKRKSYARDTSIYGANDQRAAMERPHR